MAAVVGLVTYVELDEMATDAGQLSVSARLEALLADGGRVVLLDDRGWSSSALGSRADVRALTSVEDITTTARMVVGPDEPYEDQTYEQAAAAHWDALAHALGQRPGADAHPDGRELERLPHDVVLGERLRGWLHLPPGDAS
ncbi:hypothetical protein ACIQM4_31895 [Streptomyces sp. NPDC091272]|uniref:hypothetical protein n=1 Tax=Streptomyces sp. NPDC091272 TaxID=3365981 RepID=UPI0038210571